jgi:hypothetical protein
MPSHANLATPAMWSRPNSVHLDGSSSDRLFDISNTRGITATALRAFLTTSHPKMPNLILTPEETADVIAYILSLRERPSSSPPRVLVRHDPRPMSQ